MPQVRIEMNDAPVADPPASRKSPAASSMNAPFGRALILTPSAVSVQNICRSFDALGGWETSIHVVLEDSDITAAVAEYGPRLVLADHNLGNEAVRALIVNLRLTGYSGSVVLLTTELAPDLAFPLAAKVGADDFISSYETAEASLLSHSISRVLAMSEIETVHSAGQARAREEWLPRLLLTYENEILERRRLEAKLLGECRRAEEASNAKDRFVSLVAHDLKSPFTSILGLLDILIEDSDDPLSDSQRELTTRVRETGDQLVQVIDELLELSRVRSGKIVPQTVFFELRSSIDHVLARHKAYAESKAISIANDVLTGVRCYADPMLLAEILSNLITNAIKFTAPGGTIHISNSRDEGGLAITVQDSGIGMDLDSAEARDSLFEKSTSRPGTWGERGTGLGLPLCSELAKAHGGRLTACSQPDVGSAFTLTLPDVRPNILVVDDDPGMHMLYPRLLRTLDVRISSAMDGSQALHLLETEDIHLVITDLVMPTIDGSDLIVNIRRHPNHAAVPVIVATGDPNPETRNQLFRIGADDYLQKPLSEIDLLPRVGRFVGNAAGGAMRRMV